MNKVLLTFIFLWLMTSCNDGDIIVTTFNFEDRNLQVCGGPGSYVFFKISSSALESISLHLDTPDELFLESGVMEFNLNGTSNYVSYRIYDDALGSDYFCSNIPPIGPIVTSSYLGSSGVAKLTTLSTLDDEDGVTEDEQSALDTDLDGLLNFYDFDDDGDNVPTLLELGDDPENPRDFDGDGIKDYLDPDDDNDGVLTRYEAGGGLDPITMVTDPLVGPDYLNIEIANEVVIDAYRTHTYNLSSDITLLVSNLVLSNGEEEITQETLDFGGIENIVNQTISVIPVFN